MKFTSLLARQKIGKKFVSELLPRALSWQILFLIMVIAQHFLGVC